MSLKKFLVEFVGLGFLSLLGFAFFIVGLNILSLGVVYILSTDKSMLGAFLASTGTLMAGGAYMGAERIRRGRKG